MEHCSSSGANLVFARRVYIGESLGRMDIVMTTMPAVGATGSGPREPLNSGHRTKWHGPILPHPWVPGMVALHPRRATAGRPYR